MSLESLAFGYKPAAFVRFAVDHPGHFRLMFRHDLVERAHLRYEETRLKPGTRFDTAVAAYHGKAGMDLDRFEDAADFFGAMATVHGLAHLVLAEKGTLGSSWEKDLPEVLARMYPSKTRPPGVDGFTPPSATSCT